MKALKQLCTPRKSVFDVSKRDTVLNLTHLTDDKLSAAEFFEENSVTEGMRTLLIEAHRRLQGKSTEDVSSETFRKKIEARLFTTPTMLWSEVKKRAAMNPQWQWHRRDALDALKDDLVRKEIWREDDAGYVDRSPPPAKTTSIQFQERSRDDVTGAVELRITPIHGDTVYAEVGGEATAASQKVENGLYTTDEIEVSFLAVDSTGTHPNGPATTWKNRITLKHRIYAGSKGERMLELSAAPNKGNGTTIHYTTNGSDPKVSGGTYESPVALRKNTPIVLAYAERDGVESEVLQITIDWSKKEDDKPIDPEKPAVWKRPHAYHFTAETYEFLERLKRHDAKVSGVKVTIVGDRWVELNLHPLIELTPAQLADAVEAVRKIPETGQLSVEAAALHFPTGQRLLDWLNEAKAEPKPGEVQQ